ncbi:MAG: UDP-N-acetylmuramoyl-L-alanyl-D-glutamate--2,6-diaminopimelate ligase [Myxococcales bacterium]|nr:UDP-N-acetylmuramoyl-L-alanyl-D-glutamate--2,6-diaminopimelate ligase [Myxococcales bacterium]
MKLSVLANSAGLRRVDTGSTDPDVLAIATDSREVREGTVFFARMGWFVDANRFVGAAERAGAVGLVVTREDAVADAPHLPAYLSTHEDRDLSLMADVWFEHPTDGLLVFGVTGTNGKTSVAYLLEHILRALGHRPAVIGTVSHRFESTVLPARNTTPDGLLVHGFARDVLDRGATALILEVSSHGAELGRIAGVSFDVVGFTNLTPDHLDFHGDMESYFNAKASLFGPWLSASVARGSRGAAVAWTDDPAGDRILAAATDARARTRVGARNGDLTIRRADGPPTVGTRFAVAKAGGVSIEGCAPVVGDHNLANIGVALAMVDAVVPDRLAEAVASLASFGGVPGRLELACTPSPGEPPALVDYAHTPDAVERVVRAVAELGYGRPTVVLGCGGDRDRSKRGPMLRAAAAGAARVIATADNPRSEDAAAIVAEMLDGLAPELAARVEVRLDRSDAIEAALRAGGASAGPVLVAGKGHETYQEVTGVRYHLDDGEELRRASAALRSGISADRAPLLAGWSSNRVADACGGVLVQRGAERGWGALSIDSRAVEPSGIFAAIVGERHDAHAFLAAVVAAGAGLLIVSDAAAVPADAAVSVVVVDDTVAALQRLASALVDDARSRRGGLCVVAITGSNGKTTTKELTAALLGPDALATKGNLNNHIGLPLTVARLAPAHRYAVLEMGANRPGDIDELAAIARPDVAVITSIGEAHLEGLGGLDGVRREKAGVLRHGASVAILPAPEAAAIATFAADRTRHAHLRGRRRGVLHRGHLRARPSPPDRRYGRAREVAFSLPGEHNALDLAAAVLATEAATGRRREAPAIEAALGALELPPGRLRSITLGGRVVIDDTYNANPASVRASLSILAAAASPRIAVIGEMRELGADAEALHRGVGESAARVADVVVAIGSAAAPVAAGAGDRGVAVDDHAAAGAWLAANVPAGATVLLKGSRGARVEAVIPFIEAAWTGEG